MELVEYEDYRKVIKDAIANLKAKNPNASFQYCARKIKTTNSYLKLVVAKKRQISLDKIPALCKLFGFTEFEQQFFTFLFLRENVKDAVMVDYFEGVLSVLRSRKRFTGRKNEFHHEMSPIDHEIVFSSYDRQVIHALARTSGFDVNPEGIGGRLAGQKRSNSYLEGIMEDLVSNGLIKQSAGGKTDSEFIYRQPEATDIDQFKLFKVGLQAAMVATEKPVDFRPNQFFMMALAYDKESWQEFKSKFLKLRDEAIEISLNCKSPTDVYFISNNVFSATV